MRFGIIIDRPAAHNCMALHSRLTCRWRRRRSSRSRLRAAHKGSACSCKAAGVDQPHAPPGRIQASRIGARRGWMTSQSADAAQPGPFQSKIRPCNSCRSVRLSLLKQSRQLQSQHHNSGPTAERNDPLVSASWTMLCPWLAALLHDSGQGIVGRDSCTLTETEYGRFMSFCISIGS